MPATFNERLLCKKDMLLLTVLAFLDLASSYGTKEICYGGSYEVPIHYTPPLFTTTIYYKPRGKQKILAVSDGKSLHKRFLVRTGSVKIKDLTEQDDNAVVYFGQSDSVKLDIEDCQEAQSSFYGDLFSWKIPSSTEYIEFSQMMSSGYAHEPVVIWNRTDASSSRGTVKRSYYELPNVKQKDRGYYKCLGSKGDIIRWKRLRIEEYHQNEYLKVGENLEMDFPVKFALSRILFTSQESGYEQEIEILNMDPRMRLTERYFSFMDIKEEDAGSYKFIDNDGFLALQLEINVEYYINITDHPGWVYLVAFIVIFLFTICCCCCVKKCCCKKGSNKRSSTETDAPPAFSHFMLQDTTQPTQPVVPLLTREPRIIHADLPTYNSAVGNMDLTPPTQITVPGGLESTSTPVISNSSDSEPKFEFKGMAFPSAPPLSSCTNIQDVYTSDKLNFL